MIIKKGDKYNKLTAIRFIEMRKNSQKFWLFKCDCGNEKVINVSNVKNKNTRSCGCLRMIGNSSNHGMTDTEVYHSWAGMKQRCLNKNCKEYKYYGERGIKVCKSWLNFENFYQDMGERPENKSLDRIDNNGNYCKENCRWATIKEQMNNTRHNRYLTYNGKTQNIKQWSIELGINYNTLKTRLRMNNKLKQ